jgi:hypothetical protein
MVTQNKLPLEKVYPNFICSTFATHHSKGGCFSEISFGVWGSGICHKNDAAAGTKIS